MLKIRSPVITRVLFWCLQFSLQDELHTGLIKAGASVGCGNHVLYVKLMTLSIYKASQGFRGISRAITSRHNFAPLQMKRALHVASEVDAYARLVFLLR